VNCVLLPAAVDSWGAEDERERSNYMQVEKVFQRLLSLTNIVSCVGKSYC